MKLLLMLDIGGLAAKTCARQLGDIVWPSLLMLDFLIFARRLRDPMKLLNHSFVLIGTHTSALYVDGDALPCPENGQRNDLF